ncbi:MAG: hypothetical protein E7K46_08135 [Corynebacterium sp.]|nr:hypothetical protein [Corynebacterium sp.]
MSVNIGQFLFFSDDAILHEQQDADIELPKPPQDKEVVGRGHPFREAWIPLIPPEVLLRRHVDKI